MSKYDEEDTGFGLVFWGTIVAVIGVLALIYLIVGTNLIVGREFSKFAEETRRQVFEESRSYQEGMAQDLDRLCLEWQTTDNAAIATSIRHRSSGFKGELPTHIQECVDKARKGN